MINTLEDNLTFFHLTNDAHEMELYLCDPSTRERWDWNTMREVVAITHEDGSYFRFIGANLNLGKIGGRLVLIARPEHNTYQFFYVDDLKRVVIKPQGKEVKEILVYEN